MPQARKDSPIASHRTATTFARSYVAVPAWLPSAVVAALLTARRMTLMGPFPTGLDGGEWLAIGRGLLGGPGRATEGAYAPLVPVSTALAATGIGDLPAVRLMALLSCLALLGAIAAISVGELGPWVGAVVVAVAGSASAVVEPMAFGGYPQQFALAGTLLAAWGAAHWLIDGRPRTLALAAGALCFVALAHHVYALLAVATIGAAALAWLAARPGWPVVVRRAWPLPVAVAVAAALAFPTLRALRDAGYAPPLEASAFGLADAWRYSVREAVPLWTLVAALGVAFLIRFVARPGRTPLALASFGLVGASLVAFLLFAEPRSTPPLIVGATIGAALAVRFVPRPAFRAATLATAIAAALLVYRGDGESIAFFRFYRVLDASLVDAAAAVEAARPSGIVAVRADRRGWPIGWWYEGLTTARIAVGSDARWLGFPGELAAAAEVAELFDGSLSPGELADRAAVAGVELLAVRKWEWIGWERWLTAQEPAVSVLYDDDVTLILRVAPPTNP